MRLWGKPMAVQLIRFKRLDAFTSFVCGAFNVVYCFVDWSKWPNNKPWQWPTDSESPSVIHQTIEIGISMLVFSLLISFADRIIHFFFSSFLCTKSATDKKWFSPCTICHIRWHNLPNIFISIFIYSAIWKYDIFLHL